MGVHTLVTGLNGAGKTLYTVATKLKPLSEATINYQGRDIPRRLVVGGIPELLIPHELMDVPEIDPETWVDRYRNMDRRPGSEPVRWLREVKDARDGKDWWYEEYESVTPGEDPAVVPGVVPLVCDATCWWLWCRPGDVIVIDECQRLFRPMASGRRVPRFIARLETARHYGVEFIHLTQHPQLLHVNLRNLVGPHEDVRRIFGTGRVMVYQWDKASNPDRIAKGTGRMWKHDKKAFGLYKSSQLHTKFGQRLPIAVYAVVLGVGMLTFLGWKIKERLAHRFGDEPVAAAVSSSPASAAGGANGQGAGAGQQKQGGDGSKGRFPQYDPEPSKVERDPYWGRAFQIEGGYDQDEGPGLRLFGLMQDGQRIGTVTLAELVKAGYAYTVLGPCSGLLRFHQLERVVSCPAKMEPMQRDAPKDGAIPSTAAPAGGTA